MNRLAILADYLRKSFCLGWNVLDRPRVFLCLMRRFLARKELLKLTNRVMSVGLPDGPLYFRDNRLDPGMLHYVFESDYHIGDCKLFVDVGANIGLVSRNVRLHSPGCKLICFEPLEMNAKLCQLNNPSAAVERCCVGAREGRVKLPVVADDCMASSIISAQQNPQSFPVLTLDRYFSKNPIRRIDVLKIDVEGMEVDVLRGAEKILSKTRRVVAETHSAESLDQLRCILSSRGFMETRCAPVGKELHISEWANQRPASGVIPRR
jgi:FkbM family methyltransferase